MFRFRLTFRLRLRLEIRFRFRLRFRLSFRLRLSQSLKFKHGIFKSSQCFQCEAVLGVNGSIEKRGDER